MSHPFTLTIGTNTNPNPLVTLFSQRLQIPQNRHIGQPNHGLGHVLNADTISQIGSSQQMLDEERSLQVRQRQPEPQQVKRFAQSPDSFGHFGTMVRRTLLPLKAR